MQKTGPEDDDFPGKDGIAGKQLPHRKEREISRSHGFSGLHAKTESLVFCMMISCPEKLVLGKDSGSGLDGGGGGGERGMGGGSDCRMEPVNSHSLFSLQVNVLFGRDLNRIVRRSGDDAEKGALVALRGQ